MNKKRILKLADVIETEAGQHGLGFNMDTYLNSVDKDISGHNCGTVACIAGWTTFLFDPRGRLRSPARASKDAIAANNSSTRTGDFHNTAGDILGLTEIEANELFLPSAFDDPTPAQAAKVLRHLAETGEVEWG